MKRKDMNFSNIEKKTIFSLIFGSISYLADLDPGFKRIEIRSASPIFAMQCDPIDLKKHTQILQ